MIFSPGWPWDEFSRPTQRALGAGVSNMADTTTVVGDFSAGENLLCYSCYNTSTRKEFTVHVAVVVHTW